MQLQNCHVKVQPYRIIPWAKIKSHVLKTTIIHSWRFIGIYYCKYYYEIFG